MPYRLSAFGVLPPLWSSAAMKPLADLTFSYCCWFMAVLRSGCILRARRPAELSLAVALPAFVQRRRHAAAREDFAHVQQRARVEHIAVVGAVQHTFRVIELDADPGARDRLQGRADMLQQ